MSKAKYPTLEELSKVFYIRDSKLYRFKNNNLIVERVVKKDYCRVRFSGRQIYYHVIFWILSKGDIPEGVMIDHIDGDRYNSQLSNLRLVTNRENASNKKIHRDGKTVGCYFDTKLSKWRAQISINGKKYHLGYFKILKDAEQAYKYALEGV